MSEGDSSTRSFNESVADVHRELKRSVDARPVNNPPDSDLQPVGGLDRSVKEQVISDLDGLIEKRGKQKPFSGTLP